MVVVGWLGTATVTTQGPQGSHDTTKSGDFLATTGDRYLATSGDFFMATDRPTPHLPIENHPLESRSIPLTPADPNRNLKSG